jgi:LRR receptor-like serine/threonine-protein kinase FLS2
MYGNSLVGPIPRGMGNLDLLQFQAHLNNFSSPIPEDFWNNQRLIDLRLDGNQLDGTISSLIGTLQRLVDLRLGGNLFTGTIAPEIAGLANLRKYPHFVDDEVQLYLSHSAFFPRYFGSQRDETCW